MKKPCCSPGLPQPSWSGIYYRLTAQISLFFSHLMLFHGAGGAVQASTEGCHHGLQGGPVLWGQLCGQHVWAQLDQVPGELHTSSLHYSTSTPARSYTDTAPVPLLLPLSLLLILLLCYVPSCSPWYSPWYRPWDSPWYSPAWSLITLQPHYVATAPLSALLLLLLPLLLPHTSC